MKLKRIEILLITLISVVILATFVVSNTMAEQDGSSPDSGENSLLKETYNTLVGLDYGVETGSNGVIWNRIMSASTWDPVGTATAEDVAEGVTFYGDERTLETGTLAGIDYENMELQTYDYKTNNGDTYPTWTMTNSSPEVWKDERTGLYWGPRLSYVTNNFNVAACDFFSSVPRGSYDGSDADCGVAINLCATETTDANNDGTPDVNWYLPTQADAMQGYLDGVVNATNISWANPDYLFWTSTGATTVSTSAWYVRYDYGYFSMYAKSSSSNVRCVLRTVN